MEDNPLKSKLVEICNKIKESWTRDSDEIEYYIAFNDLLKEILTKDSGNDVYKIIGYHGEYTLNVKKAIRKLLKENHPDNQGDRDKFELINKVKEELENNEVPLKYRKKTTTAKKYDDIDYDFCIESIKNLKKKNDEYKDIIKKYRQDLEKLEIEYRDIYRKSIDLELNLLSSSKEAKKIRNIKILSIIIIAIISIVFALSIMKNSIILLIFFAILAIICVFIVESFFTTVNDMNKNNKRRLKEYFTVNKKIRENMIKQDELKNKLLSITRKNDSIENDIRFYNNLIK